MAGYLSDKCAMEDAANNLYCSINIKLRADVPAWIRTMGTLPRHNEVKPSSRMIAQNTFHAFRLCSILLGLQVPQHGTIDPRTWRMSLTRSTGATAVLAKIPASVPATASLTARVPAIEGGVCGIGVDDILHVPGRELIAENLRHMPWQRSKIKDPIRPPATRSNGGQTILTREIASTRQDRSCLIDQSLAFMQMQK